MKVKIDTVNKTIEIVDYEVKIIDLLNYLEQCGMDSSKWKIKPTGTPPPMYEPYTVQSGYSQIVDND